MRNSVKIILLALAILIAIGGVLFFYKTIVSPPERLQAKNQYVNSITKDISRMTNRHTLSGIDSAYVSITDEIKFQHGEGLLSDGDNDKLLKELVTKHVPVFRELCDDLFGKSVWNETVLVSIKKHVEELRLLKSSNGTTLIEGATAASLGDIYSVVTHYYEAKSVAAATGYSGLDSSKHRITSAMEYANMSPLCNCTSLVNSLKRVPERLEQSHYSYLLGRIEKLRSYYNYSQSDYDDLALRIASEIDDYKENAKKVYGRISDVDLLKKRAGAYYDDALFPIKDETN